MDDKIHKLTFTQAKESRNHTQFYPRVKNKTTITFSKEVMELLNKGLKYNLGHKRKSWISNLTLEAENAIMSLPTSEQDGIRRQIAQIYLNCTQTKKKTRLPELEGHTRKEGHKPNKTQTDHRKSMITKADKGNTVIIIYPNDYNKKVSKFITDNDFLLITNDITDKLKKEIKERNQNPLTSYLKKNDDNL